MDRMNEAITSLPFSSGISYGFFDIFTILLSGKLIAMMRKYNEQKLFSVSQKICTALRRDEIKPSIKSLLLM